MVTNAATPPAQARCPFSDKPACDYCPALALSLSGKTSPEQQRTAALADALARNKAISPHLCKPLAGIPENFLYTLHTWQERIHFYAEIDSTNTAARTHLEQAMTGNPLHRLDGSLTDYGHKLHGSIFVAEKQTGGRGRQGRSFYSPEASGLYLSLIVIPPGGVTQPSLLTATAAVAVCRAIEQLYEVNPSIKWVNDLFLDGKKICGILTEGVADAATGTIPGAVVGIGINLAPPPQGFPKELTDIAGAILPAGETNLKKKRLIAAVVQNFLQSLETAWQHSRPQSMDNIMAEYRKRSLLKPGQQVEVFPLAGSREQSYTATCIGIDHLARLQVRLEDGSYKLLDSGEVSLKSSCLVQN